MKKEKETANKKKASNVTFHNGDLDMKLLLLSLISCRIEGRYEQ